MNAVQKRKKAFESSKKVLLDKYHRNLISLEDYKFELAFLIGMYGQSKKSVNNLK